MKRILQIIPVVALLVAAVAGVSVWQARQFMSSTVNLPEEGALFEIAPGSSFAAVTGKLVDAGIIEDDFWFRLYARLTGEAGGIQAGE